MAIYNSPVLGQAFTNLAKMFAPPDSGDLANYALARERNGNAQRLADLFSYAQAPDFNQTTFDRLGQAGGQWTPSTGYYGVDVGAATSRANNSADNARAVEIQRMQGENDLAKLYATPLKVGNNETAYIPAPAQGPMGMPPVLRGNVTLNPGEQATLPGGEVISGAPKPLSVDEVNAQNQQRLQATGQIGDQQLVDMILGKETPVQAVGPDGKTPVFMTPGAAVREGAQPYNKPTADSNTEITRLIAERDALPVGDPNRQAYDARIQALGRGQQQSAYDKQTDEDIAKLGTALFDSARKAVTDRGSYQTILAAVQNPNVSQGTLGQASLVLNKALNAFGLDGGVTAPAEMLAALGNSIALRLRDPDSGAGMPGALSDSDREFLRSMSVSLGNSREANQLLAEYYLAAEQRSIDQYDLASKYIGEHGRLDEGFRQSLIQYSMQSDPTKALREKIAGIGAAAPAPAVAPAAAAPAAAPAIDPRAIEMLRANPTLAPQFDETFGPGAAQRVLGGQ